MARRIELGAGLAAAVLTIFTLAMLLTAPIVPVCPGGATGGATGGHCASALRLIPLTAAGKAVHASVWITIIVLSVVVLVGGSGAVLDGAVRRRGGALLLWPAAIIALGGCVVMGAQGSALSVFFLPPVLALSIAACAAFATRRGGAPRPRATDRAVLDERPGQAARGGHA